MRVTSLGSACACSASLACRSGAGGGLFGLREAVEPLPVAGCCGHTTNLAGVVQKALFPPRELVDSAVLHGNRPVSERCRENAAHAHDARPLEVADGLFGRGQHGDELRELAVAMRGEVAEEVHAAGVT